ncbi:MAG: hypothetical protein M3281_03825 [Chloroflexota bacterium]|nr:hypothetical protein [Chloroflexota bacterium]
MQKYEREIAELLERLEEQDRQTPGPVRRDHPPQLPRRRAPVRPRANPFRALSLSPAASMMAGLGLVILSWIVPNATLQQWLAVLGVVLFLWPIVGNLFSRRSYGSHQTKTWRGRSLEPEERTWGEIRASMGNAARDFRRRFRRRY